jgi:glycosyltransferase involved in cell wall biosynthesis
VIKAFFVEISTSSRFYVRMNKWPVSLVIIALNEEKNIQRCIQSAPQVFEVIVVDSFSADRTAEFAQKAGARVVQNEFQGFRAQKEYATNLASQPWVLSLDADEALSSALSKEIDLLFEKKQDHIAAFKIPRLSFHLGRWIKHGGWYPDYQTRLFQKNKAQWVGGQVHESVSTKEKVEKLKNPIHHYVFENLEDQMATNNRYSSEGAKDLIKKGENFSLLKLVFKPIGKFFETYFWKLGFLDGSAGFIISLGAAQSLFLKYAKLWEFKVFNK